MVEHFGLDVVRAYMIHVQNNAEESVRRVLGVLKDGQFCYEMDSGAKICVSIKVDREAREAVIDFTGTAPQQDSNFNAPSAVCMAAVLYVFRLMVDDDIPLNGGCLKPLKIIVPEDSMLNPKYPAAVVAGNVETSQAITDTLLGALGLMGACQGTMNNFTFGNDAGYQNYETICGGRILGVQQRKGTIVPGDVFMLNTPYNGGTHLPDVTVITPVFDATGESILFYVASRGHHAEIGGITPGSVPPSSKHIDEEGVLIDNFQLVSGGRLMEAETEELFTTAPYPTRNFYHNLADLKAQIAANEKGVQELHKMVEHFGLDVVRAYMIHVQNNAEESVRRVLGVLKDGQFCYEMDSGAKICVSIKVDREAREAVIDFTGTAPQQDSNFNAPSAVCMAAVLYVFRLMVDDDIPLNGGCLKPLKIIVPEDSMLNPKYPAAVVAGNVETSQAITDTLLGALGLMGACQGTMNNFTFGNDAGYQNYETICGGRILGVQQRKGTIVPGDVFMLNTPYNGGTHLPDVTVITPVFDATGESILFYVASRGHHAEIGGITPGSVPPSSKHIDEEGVLIDNFQLVSGGRLMEAETEELFTTAPYPTRNFYHNLADLKAQIAANEKGVQELHKMVEHFGLDVVRAYMIHVQNNAEESMCLLVGGTEPGVIPPISA